jgi:hypothetical protein
MAFIPYYTITISSSQTAYSSVLKKEAAGSFVILVNMYQNHIPRDK